MSAEHVTPKEARVALVALARRMGQDGLSPQADGIEASFGAKLSALVVVSNALEAAGLLRGVRREEAVLEALVRQGYVARTDSGQVCIVNLAAAVRVLADCTKRLEEQRDTAEATVTGVVGYYERNGGSLPHGLLAILVAPHGHLAA